MNIFSDFTQKERYGSFQYYHNKRTTKGVKTTHNASTEIHDKTKTVSSCFHSTSALCNTDFTFPAVLAIHTGFILYNFKLSGQNSQPESLRSIPVFTHVFDDIYFFATNLRVH